MVMDLTGHREELSPIVPARPPGLPAAATQEHLQQEPVAPNTAPGYSVVDRSESGRAPMVVPHSVGEFLISEARGTIDDLSQDISAAAQAVAGAAGNVANRIGLRGRRPPQASPTYARDEMMMQMHANEPTNTATPELFNLASRSPVGRSGGQFIPPGRLETSGRAEDHRPAFLQTRSVSSGRRSVASARSCLLYTSPSPRDS